jgi:hypothetical protein
VRVTAKPPWGFQPKNWEEREVPVPQKLITMLQKFRPANATPDDPLFPSATGRPDGAMLEKLKGVAWGGELNCGHCATAPKRKDGTERINRCNAGPYCGRWFLHKFRHTYATRHLQDGVDIRTLKQWMGHRDIASTMVYLKGLRNSDIQARINKGSLGSFRVVLAAHIACGRHFSFVMRIRLLFWRADCAFMKSMAGFTHDRALPLPAVRRRLHLYRFTRSHFFGNP